MTVTFTSDLSAAATPLTHAWEHTVGSSRALLALRADWQHQLQRCHDELGFRHVRFHGLLSDDMGTLISHQDKPLYSFFNADRICDFLLSIGMRPFVELGFMPEMLASGPETVFQYRGNVTPPADDDAWATLIRTLVGHWVDRYGVDEVRQWFFEVWNEPNLPAFWTGTQEDYFKLYGHTAQAIKSVDASLRVGGPATAMTAWVDELLDYGEKNRLPVDFISTHIYPTDPLGFEGADTEEQLANSPRHLLRDRARLVREHARERPVYFTEWNVSSNPRDHYHDEPFAAAYAAKIVLETDPFVDGYSFWTFTDIFEENYFPSVPFHGGFGLLNLYGVPKPVYRAFQLLHALGRERLPVAGTHETVDAWVVRKGRSITVLLTNHAQPRHEIVTQLVEVRLTGARAPRAAYIERIDEDHANPRRQWLEMGKPEYLIRAHVQQLEAASRLVKEPLGCSYEDRVVRFQVDLAPHAVAAVTLELVPESSDIRLSPDGHDDPSSTTPQDAYERERLDNVHPAGWRNPEPADRYSLVVVGAGTAGLVAAHAAAALGAKVALVERHLLGGDCLNVSCVPSKAIIRTSRLYAEMRHAEQYGAHTPAEIHVDFAAVMARMRGIRARISRADSVRRLVAAGVDVFFGQAYFTGTDALTVDDATLRFKKALIATGARPDTPSIPGLVEAGYLTNESIFDLTELPRRLLVIGGGPLGCELAQAFCRFGAQTIIAQSWPLFLPKEERDAAQILSDAFARDGVEVRLNTEAVNVRVEGGQKLVDLVSDDYHSTVAVDAILVGTGRLPNVEGLDLEAADVDCEATTGVRVNDFLQTSNPRIYAAGDACLEHKFTHTADASARIVVQNALFLGRQRLSALTIPWCTYTDPEIAHVGLYVRQARERGIPVKTFTIPMHDVDRAIADDEETGFVKIHVKERTDRILGATIVASHAGEMIKELTLAMVAGIGLRTLTRVIHAYPTQADAIKKAADAYNRTRLTPTIRSLLRRWVTW